MILPANKLFRLIRGVTFDYRFSFLLGAPGSSTGFNLTGYTASWVLTSTDNLTTLATYTTGAASGHSGVFFGGDNNDPTNGIIDLVISDTDTAALIWTRAYHQLALTAPDTTRIELIKGGINVIGTLPT